MNKQCYKPQFDFPTGYEVVKLWVPDIGQFLIPMEGGTELELRNMLYVMRERLEEAEAARDRLSVEVRDLIISKQLIKAGNENYQKQLETAKQNFQTQFEHWKKEAKEYEEEIKNIKEGSKQIISELNQEIKHLQSCLP